MRLVIIVVSSILAGCAGIATQEGFEHLLRSWEGNDINSLIISWGPPTRVDDLPNGAKIYTYIRTGSHTTPTYITPIYTSPSYTRINVYGNTAFATTTPGVTSGGQILGGQTYAMSCTVSFSTNRSQKIVTWRYEGNACKAVVPTRSTNLNRANGVSVTNDLQSNPPEPMICQADTDCTEGQSCRSRKGGGTECRPKSSTPKKF